MHAIVEIDDDDDIMEISVDETNDDLIFDNVRLRSCISISVHKHMITHVLWPRKLSSMYSETTTHETALVALMTDTLDLLENNCTSLTSSAKLFRAMFNTNTSPDAHIISMEINRLKHGEMFGFFIKHQNCGLSIYVPPSADGSSTVQAKSAIVSTFPVAIDNKEIYAATHSEFQVIFA